MEDLAIFNIQKLTGKALNWAVALAEGYKPPTLRTMNGCVVMVEEVPPVLYMAPLTYDERWELMGPIIERVGMSIELNDFTSDVRRWRAETQFLDEPYAEAFGPTPLIAAARCRVAQFYQVPGIMLPVELLP